MFFACFNFIIFLFFVFLIENFFFYLFFFLLFFSIDRRYIFDFLRILYACEQNGLLNLLISEFIMFKLYIFFYFH